MKNVLENIRVVELGGYIVGSFCATLLADMGANVIKIESFSGDGLRGQLGAFQGYNRGKRGMVIDFRTPEGKVILRKLAERADVLVQNLRQGVAEQWQADYKTVSEYNPKIVYLAMPGFGQTGPYIERPAFDPLLQAMSGAMAAQGGKGKPPVYLRAAISDFTGAMLGAYGIALALYTRAKTGKGQFIHSSLLNATIAIQASEFIDYKGKKREPMFDSSGKDAIHRLYQTKNDWIFIGCETEAHWHSLCQTLGKEKLCNDSRFKWNSGRVKHGKILAAMLESVLKEYSTRYWLTKLKAAGVPCSRVNYFHEMMDNKQFLANNLVAEHDTKDMGMIKQRGMVVNLSATPGIMQRRAPELGEHNDEILTEIGYSAAEIKAFRDKGVIK